MSSGVWYRTLVYLGLREEPEEGYDDLPERPVATDPDARTGETDRHDRFDPVGDPDAREELPARRDEAVPAASRRRDRTSGAGGSSESNVRPLRVAGVGARGGSAVRLAVVPVAAFEDVEAVGSRYRTGQPVLFDLAEADRATGRRVVDFVSGLTYASRGSMRKVGTRAFLLVPDGVSLPDDELDRLDTLGYHLGTGSGRG